VIGEAFAELVDADVDVRRACKLVAVIATVIPDRVALPILPDSATPVSA